MNTESLARQYEQLCERLAAVERTRELLHAVDAHDLMERPARVLRKLIELSYGQGQTSVRIESQRKLAALVGFAETKMGEALDALVSAQMLQIYPETKLYEVLPNWQKWRARPRCRFGLGGAAELEAEIIADDQRRRGEQIEFAEQEQSFAPDTTLKEAAGQLAREEAGLPPETPSSSWTEANPVPNFVPSTGADARESQSEPNPSATIISEPATAGPVRLSDMLRQSLGLPPRPKLTVEVSFEPPTDEGTAPKLTGKVSFGDGPIPTLPEKLTGKVSSGDPKPQGGGKNLPFREVSSRACASDHQSSSSVSSVSSPNQQFSSDDHHDDDEPAADERCGDGKEEAEGMMVSVEDEVFGDILRKLGETGMLSFSTFWRAAIHASRTAAVHALDQVKYADRRNPGGYMRRCFYTECRQRGVKLRHPELVRGIPQDLRGGATALATRPHGSGGRPHTTPIHPHQSAARKRAITEKGTQL